MASDKDTVPGLGFKDKEKALETIKNLEGRDADYQKLAVKGLIGRAKRTLQVTKAEDKLTNIKEALEIFEKWLKDFEKQHIPNWSYLPLVTVESFLALKNHFDIKDEKIAPFLEAYKSVDGDYKKLRTVSSGEDKPTWDIVRNSELRELMDIVDEESPDMWDSDDVPTKIHTQLILWAYSPEASRIKKNLSNLQQKMEKFHLDEDTKENNKEDAEDETKNDNEDSKADNDNGEVKKSNKRKSSGNSGSEDESPEKKRAVE